MGSCVGKKANHAAIPPPLIRIVVDKPLSVNCPICYESLTENLRQTHCGCTIHEECFRQLLHSSVTTSSYPIKCPYAGCGKVIELCSLGEFLSGEEFISVLDLAFLYYTLDDHNEIVRCPRQCGFAASKIKDSGCKDIPCLVCNIDFCTVCFKEAHTDSCESVPSSFKRCKMCNNLIERYEGCNNVTCRCGYQFCWKCNSPKGCKCSPGHGYYAVDKVIANWGDSAYYICNCKGPICQCRPKQLINSGFQQK